MKSRFEVWLDGVALSTIDEAIYIRDIKYEKPTFQDSVHSYGSRNGGTLVRRYIGAASVMVSMEIHAYATAERQRICGAVAAWAMGGKILRTSDKPDKEMSVICDSIPIVESALHWTESIAVKFIAHEFPYWVDRYATMTSLTGTEETGSLFGLGYADKPFVSAIIKVDSGTLTEITLTAGDTAITLNGLNLAQDSILRIDYDERHILYIKSENTSYIANRTPESNDDLRLNVGVTNQVGFTADTTVTVAFSTKGLYL